VAIAMLSRAHPHWQTELSCRLVLGMTVVLENGRRGYEWQLQCCLVHILIGRLKVAALQDAATQHPHQCFEIATGTRACNFVAILGCRFKCEHEELPSVRWYHQSSRQGGLLKVLGTLHFAILLLFPEQAGARLRGKRRS